MENLFKKYFEDKYKQHIIIRNEHLDQEMKNDENKNVDEFLLTRQLESLNEIIQNNKTELDQIKHYNVELVNEFDDLKNKNILHKTEYTEHKKWLNENLTILQNNQNLNKSKDNKDKEDISKDFGLIREFINKNEKQMKLLATEIKKLKDEFNVIQTQNNYYEESINHINNELGLLKKNSSITMEKKNSEFLAQIIDSPIVKVRKNRRLRDQQRDINKVEKMEE